MGLGTAAQLLESGRGPPSQNQPGASPRLGRAFQKGPRSPQVSAPHHQVIPQPGLPPGASRRPRLPCSPGGPPSGRARRPSEAGCGQARVSRVPVARPGKGAPPLTSAVGVEEAQGDQGAGHQEQQQQQPRLQEASVLAPSGRRSPPSPLGSRACPSQSLDGETAQRRSPKAKAGAASTRGVRRSVGPGVALGGGPARLRVLWPFLHPRSQCLRALLPFPAAQWSRPGPGPLAVPLRLASQSLL